MRHKHGPFTELASLHDARRDNKTDAEVDLRIKTICDCIEAEGCKPVRSSIGKPIDPGFRKDIRTIVEMSFDHDRMVAGVMTSCCVDLSTLICEMDDLDEVCCWMYSWC